jgi:hypothetical protein
MRIRMGAFGWLTIGWAVLAVYVLFLMFKGLALLIVAIANACDRYNRRRAVRKAYQRHQAALAAKRAQQASYGPVWPPQAPTDRPWNYGAPHQQHRHF